MGKTTLIEWTNSTLNLGWGCTKVSAGCDNCYMYRNSELYNKDPEKIIYFSVNNARKRMITYGDRIFVNSNTDTFHEKTSFDQIDIWFNLFESFPKKIFQILTKRTNRMRKYFETRECPDNCWLGTSIEDQAHVFRADTLRRIDCKTRFISFEPVLGPIDKCNLEGIHQILIGGESDFKNPRPMDLEWARKLIKMGREAGCAIFFKQVGGIGGSGAGGHIIDGKTYLEYPKY
jgi:protein gp37